ncbi:ExbD/TolR family protein [Parvibium lacunae]|uniref:ExbD/TolR family protein n=1 Tax=Parvibium lacunae TaxID=1888893 RepID=A0A368L3D7_9BURK|nr:ExbD/TolR family protein [Parvibium lacunae]RCS58106.1 ExbD/TolR family protein [Parvibium lacunae]
MAAVQRSSRGGRGRRMMNDINVVPYIDVMLVLLIIFMVAAPMINPGTVDLPSVAKSTSPQRPPLEVILKSNGDLLLRQRDKNGQSQEQPINKNDLPLRVAELQREDPELAVVIAADKSIRYELVMQTLSSLQKRQIQKVGLLVNPENAP